MATAPSCIEHYVTLKSGYKLWARRSSNELWRTSNDATSILFIHGGPGGSCAMLKPIEDELLAHGYQTITYSQLGSVNSDNPDDPSLWTINQFTDHLEEVRSALDLEDFYLFGYSFGVVLALEYALRYPGHARGLILSDFTASLQSFEDYIQHLRRELMPESQAILAKLEAAEDFENPEWGRIVKDEFMAKHFCRLSPYPPVFDEFMQELNWKICQHFFGKNDFVVTGAAKGWDRWNDLPKITIPVLAISGEHDQCNPQDNIRMAHLLPRGTAHTVPNASHMPFYENPDDYFAAFRQFLETSKPC